MSSKQIFSSMSKLVNNTLTKFLSNLFEKLHPPLHRQGILVWNELKKENLKIIHSGRY